MDKAFAQPTRKKFPSLKISIPTQLLLISIIFIALFGMTAISKLMDVHKFQAAMLKSKPLAPYAVILSYVVPIIESIVVLLLAVPNVDEIKRERITKPKTGLWAKLWASFISILIFINNAFSKLSKKSTAIGIWASFIMMFLFTTYVIYILEKFEGNLPCTCGGIINNLTWKQHLLLNFSLLLIAARGIFLMRKQNKLNKINT